MNVLVLDNYDSFTYNLVQYIREILGQQPTVFRNDEITLDDVDAYDVIILSPGPGVPADAGIMPALIKRYAGHKRILGVCLGHQAIGEAFGGEVYNMEEVYHGMATPIEVIKNDTLLFQNMDKELVVGRYHSWVVRDTNLPDCLEVTAVDENGQIMAMRHKEHDVFGVQFHPESIMTPMGKQMLVNFLQNKSQPKN